MRTTTLLMALLAAAPAKAQWSEDPAQNLVVADRPGGQTQPKLVPTDDGGFYVSWFGNGAEGFDVFLQRLDADGQAQLATNGARIADRGFSSTEDYGLDVDAGGNALVAFRFLDDEERPQAVVSLVSPEGEPLWGTPGVFVSADASAAASPRVTGTPDGGAVVAWTSFSTGDIVLQKLDAEGAPQWGPDGVSLETPTGFFFLADLHADAEGNVVVSGSAQLSSFDRRLWAQKLDAEGAPLWGDAPVEVFDGSDGALQFGYFPPFVPDGGGGAVFAWYQVGGVGEARVRVQHVFTDGSAAFAQNGVEAAAGTDRERSTPSAAFDTASGDIYVVWPEEQQVGGSRTYGVAAQRIDATGIRQWGDAGRVLVPLGGAQGSQVSALPLTGSAIFAWSLGAFPDPMRIEAARLDADGAFVWPGNIVPLKTALTSNTRMRGALSRRGFAAYVWADGPGGSAPDAIKAQNVGFSGDLGPVAAPQAAVDPAELMVVLPPDETASATLTLSNLTAEGGDLTYAVTVVRPESVLVDFEDGENPYGFTLGIPQAETIETEGGNPGRWLRNAVLSTFVPRLYIDPVPDSPFTGDYVERNVRSISIDAQTVSAGNTVAGRPFSLRLIRHNGEPNNPEAHDYVYFPGDLVPQPGEGWRSYDFPIPSDFEGELPEGWSGGYAGDLEHLPPGVVWQDILREVDAVELMWGHPAFFYILQDFDLGVDNVQIAFDEREPGVLSVEPTEGSIAAGTSEELALLIDTAGLDPGVYDFAVRIETNDPDRPLLVVPVTLSVLFVDSAEDGSVPAAFALRQNYPNPFDRTTAIEFTLPQRERVTLAVFDVTGRRIATLVNGEVDAGTHRARWDATGLASGAYVYRLQAGRYTQTLRAVVVN